MARSRRKLSASLKASRKCNMYGEELTTLKVNPYIKRMLERFMEIGEYKCMDDLLWALLYETVEDIPLRSTPQGTRRSKPRRRIRHGEVLA